MIGRVARLEPRIPLDVLEHLERGSVASGERQVTEPGHLDLGLGELVDAGDHVARIVG